MGDVIEVEAVTVGEIESICTSLALDDTLEEKLGRLKRCVDLELEDYANVKPIETDEGFRDAKRYRSAVRKVKEPIEKQRKAAKKRYTDMLKAFDSAIGEITAPIDALDASYKSEIDAYEGACRERRAAELESYYGDLAGDMAPLVPYGRIADGRWLNASFGEMKAKKAVEDRVAGMLRQFEFVSGLDYTDGAERAWALAWWADHMPDDSGEVASAVAAHREDIERASRLAETYDRATGRTTPETPPDATEPASAVACGGSGEKAAEDASAPQTGYRVVIECATLDELRKVKAVMVGNGIHGRVERM